MWVVGLMERIAIVGSRHGADLPAVRAFVKKLRVAQPTTVLVSGGADGVDKAAEQTWLALGGRVLSVRVRETKNGFAPEVWDLGGEQPRCFVPSEEPVWNNRASALFYRNSLIAEKADRVVAFFSGFCTPGTQTTLDFAHAYGKPSYVYGLGALSA